TENPSTSFLQGPACNPRDSRGVSFGRRHVSARPLGAAAGEESLHLARQILAGALVGEIEPILVDEHRLVLHPRRPAFLAPRGVDALPALTGMGRAIEPLGVALQIYAVHCSWHVCLRRGAPRAVGRYLIR